MRPYVVDIAAPCSANCRYSSQPGRCGRGIDTAPTARQRDGTNMADLSVSVITCLRQTQRESHQSEHVLLFDCDLLYCKDTNDWHD